MNVSIDPDAWRSISDDGSWLKCNIAVNGLPLHLDALEVGDAGLVQDLRGELASALAALHEALAADGPWETLRIGDRDYVLLATPFS